MRFGLLYAFFFLLVCIPMFFFLIFVLGIILSVLEHPIFEAMEKKNFEKVRDLLEKSPRSANARSILQFWSTPLHVAVSAANPEISQLLIQKGAKVNARDFEGITPLHCVSVVLDYEERKESLVKIAEILIAHGADVNAIAGSCGTPLRRARNLSRSEIVSLLEQHGAK